MDSEPEASDAKQLLAQLKEIAKWTRLQGIQKARELLSEVLRRDSDKLAYENSDGRGSGEVGKAAGISDFAVRSYWKKWAALGLVVPSEKYKGRFERLFSLTELGFEVPLSRGSAAGPQEETPNLEGDQESHAER